MYLTSYIFKSKAVRALKGNWQTALIVSFIAGLPITLLWMVQATSVQVFTIDITQSPWEQLTSIVSQIAPATYWLLGGAGLITLLVYPVLSVGSSYYFIKRLQGEDLGVMGVLSRRNLFWKAMWLFIMMSVRTLLWGALFVVPGIMASLRYMMAPYFLAENPEITASEAIRKSKEVMADKKISLFVLLLSFIGWALMSVLSQSMLWAFSSIIAMVAGQFIDLFRITYTNASITAFYLAASRTEGVAKAKAEADAFVREIRGESRPGSPGGEAPGTDGEDDQPHEHGGDTP